MGWQLDLHALQAIGPVDVVMNPLAALLFVAAGLALLFDGRDRVPVLVNVGCALCAASIAASGGLVLLRGVTGWDSGVDSLLFTAEVMAVSPPDWMAENTVHRLNRAWLPPTPGSVPVGRPPRTAGSW